MVKEGLYVQSQEAEFLRRLKIVDWLKTELVTNTALLFQALWQEGGQAVTDALANIVITCYVLARRLGADFAVLDNAIQARLVVHIKHDHEVEKWFGDLSALQKHLRDKKG